MYTCNKLVQNAKFCFVIDLDMSNNVKSLSKMFLVDKYVHE